MKSNIEKLNSYWKEYFEEAILTDFQLNPNKIKSVPEEIESKFQTEFAPEPFYGYLTENISNDILMLLINPGEKDVNSLRIYYPEFAHLDDESLIKMSNHHIAFRHLHWGKNDFLKRELEFNKIPRDWRTKMKKMCEKAFKMKFDFLHTIEFFPYHSKNWKISKALKQEWIEQIEATNLAINAIHELSVERKPKRIIGIGKSWVEVLEHYNNLFELVREEKILGPSGKKYAHRFYQFKAKGYPDSLPIVIYVASAIILPIETEAKNLLNSLFN